MILLYQMASPADGSARKRPRQHLAVHTNAESSAQKQQTVNFMDEIDTRAEARRELEAQVRLLQQELIDLREEKEVVDRHSGRLEARPAHLNMYMIQPSVPKLAFSR